MVAILNSVNLEFCHLGFSFCIMEFFTLFFHCWFTQNTLPPLRLWLKLIQSDSNSFILTQLDDGSHLEFCHFGFRHCHLGFRHLVFFSQIHSNLPILSPLWFWQKNFKLIHSHWTWWWQPSWILPTWFQPLAQKTSWWFSHLEFCHDGSHSWIPPSWIQPS